MNSFQKSALRSALQAKPYLKTLLKTLLSMGGDVACLWPPNPVMTESSLQEYLANAVLSSGRSAKLKKMADSQCHDNALALAAENPDMVWMTGYALSNDSVWRPHSWVWNSKKKHIVETTVRRVKYFGCAVQTSKEKHSEPTCNVCT
jgi:hypothetical protein